MKRQWLLSTMFLIVCMLVVATAIYILSRHVVIRNHAIVKTIGVNAYQDMGCTLPLTEINWGILTPGETYNHTAYLKNEGNINISLSMTTGNYTPVEALIYIDLTWDCEGILLTQNQMVTATFSLSVAYNITGIEEFSFNIYVVGTEA